MLSARSFVSQFGLIELSFLDEKDTAIVANDADPFSTAFQLYHGMGRKLDDRKAFLLFLRLAEQENDGLAAYCVAHCYDHGLGTIENDSRALRWYLKSSQTHPLGKYFVGTSYLYGRPKFFAARPIEGLRLLMDAAEKDGFSDAMITLAKMFLFGHFTEQNLYEARYWMSHALKKNGKKVQDLLSAYCDHAQTEKDWKLELLRDRQIPLASNRNASAKYK